MILWHQIIKYSFSCPFWDFSFFNDEFRAWWEWGQSLGWCGMVNIEYNMLGGSSLLPETEQGDPEQ